ncbi:cell filamentation protein Fic [Pasteurellaceae bacterium Orientalotternb1]|nr:cell filamentation protein Fic [Pasteurellaceae bacterium Orientalotternb1]
MANEQQFLLYTANNGEVNVNVFLDDETLWLTQKEMATLFDVSTATINHHLKNIFESGELEQNLTIRNFLIVRQEGNRRVSREIEHYNLDVVISVGYRVNSTKATQFRIWATKVLKEFMLKGFALDDERLKQNRNLFNKDYFRELLERVRSIRASERRIWQQVTDIFSECSIDYDPKSKITEHFFATVQNKFHYAITGQTAAEIVYTHADRTAENMGLMTWKNAPNGRILLTDTYVAKNYLTADEIRKLERTVSSYFDYIENLIERGNRADFTMERLAESVNKFLSFNEFDLLTDKGKISQDDEKQKAKAEYTEFNKTQKIFSDFDKLIKQLDKA